MPQPCSSPAGSKTISPSFSAASTSWRSEQTNVARRSSRARSMRQPVAQRHRPLALADSGAPQLPQEMGVQRFQHPGHDDTDLVGEAKFIHLRQCKDGVWEITRMISYDWQSMSIVLRYCLHTSCAATACVRSRVRSAALVAVSPPFTAPKAKAMRLGPSPLSPKAKRRVERLPKEWIDGAGDGAPTTTPAPVKSPSPRNLPRLEIVSAPAWRWPPAPELGRLLGRSLSRPLFANTG